MKKNEILEAVNRYNQRLEQFGISEQALGWGEKGRAKLRYNILLSQWDFDNSSVLDAGCGFGDLFGYMVQKGCRNFKYLGLDINSAFIHIAKEKYRGSATFHVKNLLEQEGETSVDFILSSGVFNHKLEDNMGFISASFKKFNSLSTRGFAANFLSDKVTFRNDDMFYASPPEILTLAYQYSNNIVLRNDYMPFEFTVFVNKFAEIDGKLTVYKEFAKHV